jgi:hypothetical protein
MAASVDVTLLGRFYERFADHAVEIGRRVAYQVTGQLPDEQYSRYAQVALSPSARQDNNEGWGVPLRRVGQRLARPAPALSPVGIAARRSRPQAVRSSPGDRLYPPTAPTR